VISIGAGTILVAVLAHVAGGGNPGRQVGVVKAPSARCPESGSTATVADDRFRNREEFI
jgi:hypothetical protein